MTGQDSKLFADMAAHIGWYCAHLGLDQKGYAAEAGPKPVQLSNWETGNYRVSLDGALVLCATDGLSRDYIYAVDAGSLPMSLVTDWQDHEAAKGRPARQKKNPSQQGRGFP